MRLQDAYPNPFNSTTTIRYQLPEMSDVQLQVYNINGQMVETLVNDSQDAGHHSIVFDGSRFASGVYFYRLVAGDYTDTQKMVLLK